MMSVYGKNFKRVSILGSLVIALSLAGCSGKEEGAEEPVEAEADAEAGTTEEGTAEAAAPESPTPPTATAPATPESVATPPSSAVTTSESPTPTPTVGSFNTSRRVMYVKVDGAVMREKPEPKAAVVGKLNKGDHMLVSMEGDWAKTVDGKYISVKVLSEKGIGRAKKDAAWSSGSPSSEPTSKKSAKKGTPAKTGTETPVPTEGAK